MGSRRSCTLAPGCQGTNKGLTLVRMEWSGQLGAQMSQMLGLARIYEAQHFRKIAEVADQTTCAEKPFREGRGKCRGQGRGDFPVLRIAIRRTVRRLSSRHGPQRMSELIDDGNCIFITLRAGVAQGEKGRGRPESRRRVSNFPLPRDAASSPAHRAYQNPINGDRRTVNSSIFRWPVGGCSEGDAPSGADGRCGRKAGIREAACQSRQQPHSLRRRTADTCPLSHLQIQRRDTPFPARAIFPSEAARPVSLMLPKSPPLPLIHKTSSCLPLGGSVCRIFELVLPPPKLVM